MAKNYLIDMAGNEKFQPGMEFMNTFSIKTVGDTVTIILCAQLDANNTTHLMDELQKCIGKGFKKVIYDCRGLEYVSSAGLRPFIF